MGIRKCGNALPNKREICKNKIQAHNGKSGGYADLFTVIILYVHAMYIFLGRRLGH